MTEDEIAALVAWVREGGALFLIADHMPAAGAAAELAEQAARRSTTTLTGAARSPAFAAA